MSSHLAVCGLFFGVFAIFACQFEQEFGNEAIRRSVLPAVDLRLRHAIARRPGTVAITDLREASGHAAEGARRGDRKIRAGKAN
ncbi:MAG: hypothetical protein ABIP55_10720 [Tepidisphaeraceae bacterium]